MIPTRTRKLIGTFVFVFYVIAYALIAMVFGVKLVAEAHGAWQFIYYAIAGLAWLPGAMVIIWWMARADNQA